MKKNNPNTPIMLREAAGTQPKVYARYGTLYSFPGSLQDLAGLFLFKFGGCHNKKLDCNWLRALT